MANNLTQAGHVLAFANRVVSYEGIIYAFGHGHLGLTQSAATGRLVADIAARRKPALDIEPYSISRFR